MAKILSYYQLCPINDETEFLGLSQDAESGTVINTLGKNIIISVKVIRLSMLCLTCKFENFVTHFCFFFHLQLSNQKQINSWAVQDKLSSKVVYDFNRKVYVGVFGHKWIRCWPSECSDINKVKRIRVSEWDGPLHVRRCTDSCYSTISAIETDRKLDFNSKPKYHCLVFGWNVRIVGVCN